MCNVVETKKEKKTHTKKFDVLLHTKQKNYVSLTLNIVGELMRMMCLRIGIY